jgi:hypothetical protein
VIVLAIPILSLRQPRLRYLLVLVELVLVLAAMSFAWRARSSRYLFACCVLGGMAACAFLHGFCFGVLQVEGVHPSDDWGTLAGFGIVAAFLTGIPVGLIVGAVVFLVRRKRAERVAVG